MIKPDAVVTLTVTAPDNVAWQYTLSAGTADLLAGLVNGRYHKIMVMEAEPHMIRGRPMRFDLAVSDPGGSGG